MQQNPFILETSYEIIHKVGGVETVVRSKAPEMVREYGENFLMVGPYIASDDKYQSYFEDTRQSNQRFNSMITGFEQTFGLPQNFIKFGRWLIPGAPSCILLPVDFIGQQNLEQYRHNAIDMLNREFSMDLFNLGEEKGEQFKFNAINFGVLQWLLYSYMVPNFIQKEDKTLIVQTHEWLACIGQVLFQVGDAFTRNQKQGQYINPQKIKFVFTTHATTIGRHLSAGGLWLTDCFKQGKEQCVKYAADQAELRNVKLEHQAEFHAAQKCHVLTTVSIITNEECTHFLGRSADVITWNGLHVNSQKGMVDDHELQSTHKAMKQKIMDFVQTYFYGIDDSDTQIFFTAGRNEFKNKGIDLFIDSLAALRDLLDNEEFLSKNEHLRKKTIVAFIVAPQANGGFNQHTLEVSNLLKEMQLYMDNLTGNLKTKLLKMVCTSGNFLETQMKELLDQQDGITMKRFQQQLKKAGRMSPICTHNIDDNCEIIQALKSKNLLNQPLTHVKVIFVPEFLQKTSIFGLDYQEFVRGAHLGVFASAYEPFGYTSPECMCVGCASIVSNLCGFGNLVQETQGKVAESKDFITQLESIHRISSQSNFESPLSSSKQVKQENKNSWVASQLGVQVIDRISKDYKEQVGNMAMSMFDYLSLNTYDRIALRNRMSRNAIVVDWSAQISNYVQAYDKAARK